MMVTWQRTVMKRSAVALAVIGAAAVVSGVITPAASAASYPDNLYRTFTKSCTWHGGDESWSCPGPGNVVHKGLNGSIWTEKCVKLAKENPRKNYDVANYRGFIRCTSFKWPEKFRRTYKDKDTCLRGEDYWVCNGYEDSVQRIKDVEISCANRARKDTTATIYDVTTGPDGSGPIKCRIFHPNAPVYNDGVDG